MATKDLIKLVYDVLKEANRLDLAEEIVELRNNNLDLKEENLKLREAKTSLEEQLNTKSSIFFDRGINWIEEDEMTKDKSNTPICPKCYASDKLVMRLSIRTFGERPGVHCKNCKMIHHIE